MRFIDGKVKVNIRFPNESFYTPWKLHLDEFKIEVNSIFDDEVFGWYGDREDGGIFIGMEREDWDKISAECS